MNAPAVSQPEDWVRQGLKLTRERGLGEADVLRVLQLSHAERCTPEEALQRLGLDAAVDFDPAEPVVRVPPTGRAASALVGIRALRTEILMRQSGAPCNALAVVEAAPEDGATRLASELAMSFAQLDEATLLIDANLRRPAQHRFFQLGERPGLVEALTSSAAIAYAGIESFPQLTVLGAGGKAANPQELLSSARFSAFVASARGRFRHVVVDTPDAASSSDALVIAAVIGAAVPVARIDATPLPAYAELVRRLRAAGVRVIGGVLNPAGSRQP